MCKEPADFHTFFVFLLFFLFAGRGLLLFCCGALFKLPHFAPFLPKGGAPPEKSGQGREYTGQKAKDKDKDQYKRQRTMGGKR